MAAQLENQHSRSGRHAGAMATVTAVLGILAIASTALAGSFGPAKLLRTAPAGAFLWAEDIAAQGDDIAVVWREFFYDDAGGVAVYRRNSFVRWSTAVIRNSGTTTQLGRPPSR